MPKNEKMIPNLRMIANKFVEYIKIMTMVIKKQMKIIQKNILFEIVLPLI